MLYFYYLPTLVDPNLGIPPTYFFICIDLYPQIRDVTSNNEDDNNINLVCKAICIEYTRKLLSMQQTKKKKYICNNAIWVLSILNNMYNNLK